MRAATGTLTACDFSGTVGLVMVILTSGFVNATNVGFGERTWVRKNSDRVRFCWACDRDTRRCSHRLAKLLTAYLRDITACHFSALDRRVLVFFGRTPREAVAAASSASPSPPRGRTVLGLLKTSCSMFCQAAGRRGAVSGTYRNGHQRHSTLPCWVFIFQKKKRKKTATDGLHHPSSGLVLQVSARAPARENRNRRCERSLGEVVRK